MLVTYKAFPTPAKVEELKPGELFQWHDGQSPWLCIKVTDGGGQGGGYIVLDGPESHKPPGGWPSFLSDGVIGEVVARLPAMELTIEPLGGPDHVAAVLVGSAGNGSLVVDAEGCAWICQARMAHQRSFWALASGVLGKPAEPSLGFKNWELCLREGKTRIVLASLGC